MTESIGNCKCDNVNCPFDETYFLNGKQAGVSNYENYRWLGEPTMAMAKRLIEAMDIAANDTVLEIGCARGYTVKALHLQNIDAWGYDISEWAVENCDPMVRHRIHNTIQHRYYDHVFAKDVFEHVEPVILASMIHDLLSTVGKSMLIIVPLAEAEEGRYLRAEDNLDATHVIRWPLEKWMSFVQGCIDEEGFLLSGSWHIPGLKPTSLSYMKSCGFIMLRKRK